MSRFILAPPAFQVLVANLRGGSDPSRNVGGNPVKVRTGFRQQVFTEVARGGGVTRTDSPLSPGVHAHLGLLEYTLAPVPVVATGQVTVVSTNFASQAVLHLGEQKVYSGDDYDVTTGTTYPNEDITNTAPDGIIVIYKTAGAVPGEGVINVPAHVPIEAGSVTISWTSGAVAKSQADDGAGGFSGDGNAVGSSINYASGAIILDTTGDIPDAATTIEITYTAEITLAEVAANLAAHVDALPGFSASVVGVDVTVNGPFGLVGNDLPFVAQYRGAVENFTLTPSAGFFSGGEPVIGPPDLLP